MTWFHPRVSERVIGRSDIEAADRRIRPYVRRTPVIEPGPGAFDLACRVTLKLELMQHTGSFKPRGAFNKILSSDVPEAGVIAASGGNFGLAVAFLRAHARASRGDLRPFELAEGQGRPDPRARGRRHGG